METEHHLHDDETDGPGHRTPQAAIEQASREIVGYAVDLSTWSDVDEPLPGTVRIPARGLLGGVLVSVGTGETSVGSSHDHTMDLAFGRASAPAADRVGT